MNAAKVRRSATDSPQLQAEYAKWREQARNAVVGDRIEARLSGRLVCAAIRRNGAWEIRVRGLEPITVPDVKLPLLHALLDALDDAEATR